MGDNVADATLANAGLKIPEQQTKDVLCKAFRTAWEKYCKKKHPRGYFNDAFYRALRNDRPLGRYIAANTLREVPMAVMGAGGVASASAASATVAAVGSAVPLADTMGTAYQTASMALAGANGVSGLFTGFVRSGFSLFQAMRDCGVYGGEFFGCISAGGARLRFLDGLVGNPGRPLEIKGPFDSARDANQFEDNDKADPNGEGLVVDKATCYEAANITPPDCPRYY